MTNTGVETELKIPVTDLASIRSALTAVGATLVVESEREINLLFDTHNSELSGRGCVLRLRRYGARRILTFKGPPTYEGHIKSRTEHELEIDNVEGMVAVFEELGYLSRTRYEKDREVWQLGDVEVVLDHTPMGDFVEVEGPLNALESATRSLGLDPEQAVRGSYMSLWREYRELHSDRALPIDMVFDE